ncbi:MAG: hypothetical protein HOW73_47595 [Polyangiaceae bacterium]|nr:hypothetical protein [Polyangiaceae bacterium]
MSLRDSLLPVFDSVRRLIQNLGLRRYRIWKRKGRWDGGEIHLGNLTNEDEEILPQPKVEKRGENLIVTKMTPEFDGGGYAPEDLVPPDEKAVDQYFVVQTPDGKLQAYRAAETNAAGNFGLMMVLEPIPPDLVTPSW